MAAMKHFALQLARSATKTIDDRRKRAEIKAAVYNHLIPLLNQHAKTQAATHKFYQKLLMMLGGSLLLALAVIALLLKI